MAINAALLLHVFALLLPSLSLSLSLASAQLPLRPRFGLNGSGFVEDPGRIINGTLATMEATRHQVSLRRRLNDGYYFGTGHICGGSLIREHVVLSAAHCFVDQNIYDGTFIDKADIIVVMGNLDRFVRNDNTLIFDIDELIFALAKFDLSTYDKDIALLFLSGAVPAFHPTVRPIPLTPNSVAPDTICQVTGWGLTENNYNSDVLLSVDVPLISDKQCKTETHFDESLIKAGMICAGYLDEGQHDACSGDSGGPLVCQSQLAGVVSWGIGCALPKLPGVYTEVAFYYDWIEAHIAEYEAGSGDEGSGDVGSGSGDEGSGSGDEGSGSGDEGSGSGSGDEGSGSGSGDDGSGDGGGGAVSLFASSVTLLSLLVCAFNVLII